MLERLQASSTIIEELNGNGYSGFVDEKAISPLINNIDNSLERIISNEEKYNNHEMHVKIKALITKVSDQVLRIDRLTIWLILL